MCDTFVALGNATADGSILFGKNSDREPNEAHELVIVPAATYPAGTEVKCTYLTIPQVTRTNAVLLAKPFWIWGAEMGANEHGVVIGNEALFTRVPYDKGPGMTGMDLLRLALERAATAGEALRVIVELLAEYGQGGDCGFSHPFFYHNSFLIADRHGEAWVLETVGREWAAKAVQDVATISNAITIRSEWDQASPGLVDYAVGRGWCRSRADFDFAAAYSDPLYTRFSAAHHRQACSLTALQRKKGRLTLADALAVLRYHGGVDPERKRAAFRPDGALFGADVCMHVGYGPVRINQSVGSMVSQLTGDEMTHWLTGTSAPCTSIFKPVWLEAGLPDLGPQPTGKFDPHSLFWRHEQVHRAVLQDYPARMAAFAADRDTLETRFLAGTEQLANATPAEKLAWTVQCFAQADAATQQWLRAVQAVPARRSNWFYYNQAWRAFNSQAEFTG